MSQMTMTDRERGFLDAVLADPSDDFPRLVYADWLEDEGRTERAEFIRQAIRYPHAAFARLTSSVDPFALLGLTPGQPVQVGFGSSVQWRTWMWGETDDFGCVIQDLGRRLDYREDRGFVSGLRCTLADFMTHAGAIFAAAPVEEVTITDRHPGHDTRGYQGWWGTDDLVVGGDNIPLRLHAFLLPSPFWQRGNEDRWTWYRSEAEAIAALSLACIAYARDKAGLPVLPYKEAAHP